MFQGTLPPDVLSVLHPTVKAWGCEDVAFPCSGRFTIPRSMADLGLRMHGNDVTLYSCAIGEHYAGRGVDVAVRPGMGLEWLEPYFADRVDRTAAVLAFSEFAEAWLKREKTAYHRRIADAARDQFPRMHAKVAAGLRKETWHLASFFAGDCVDFLGTLPPEAGVLTFPPVYSGGYEKMFECLHRCFEWTPPDYRVFTPERLNLFLEKVTSRRFWIYGAQQPVEHPALDGRLLCKVRKTIRGTPFWVYGSEFDVSRLVTPRQESRPSLIPKLRDGEPIGDAITLVELSTPEFTAIRSQFLDPAIPPAAPQVRVGLLVDGKLVGCIGFSRSNFDMKGVDTPSIYMMCDFGIGSHARLSKLVVASALSRECQLLLERVYDRRLRSVVTTAFAKNPVSMKYRGVFKLLSRTEMPEGSPHRFQLNYGGPLGGRTLAETLAWWKSGHGNHGQG